MSLKDLVKTVKSKDFLIQKLDMHLLREIATQEDDNHSHSWNSPSGIYSCMRAQYYRRVGEKVTDSVSPRAQRIFDNGHGVHDRLQGYLMDEGILRISEVPIFNEELQIMGHADGLLAETEISYSILELKSINAQGFAKLKDAKDEHKQQAQVYLFNIELLRSQIFACKTRKQLITFKRDYLKSYENFLKTFIVSGSKFTAEEKIAFKVKIMEEVIDLLKKCTKPIKRIYFLYEDKNTQELKEFCVEADESMIDDLKARCKSLNEAVVNKKLPPRDEDATSKSCRTCTYCDYKLLCWK